MNEGLVVIRCGRVRLVAKVVRDDASAPWRVVHQQAFEDALPRRVYVVDDSRSIPAALRALVKRRNR